MIRRNLVLSLMLIATLLFTGCFGFLGSKLDLIELTVEDGVERIVQGNSVTILAVGKDSKGKAVTISPKWTVEPEKLGTITEDGVFTASETEEGIVTIKATDSEISETIKLEVISDTLKELGIEADYAKMIVGQTLDLQGVATGNSGLTYPIANTAWSEDSDGSIGDLDVNGSVATFTATAVGKVDIKLQVGDKEEKFQLEVVQPDIAAVTGWPFDNHGGPDGYKVPSQTGDAERNGYSKEVFFVGWDTAGTWLEWEIEIPKEEDYILAVRYATHNSSYAERSFAIRLADDETYESIEKINFPKGGQYGGEGWLIKQVDETVSLKAGSNIVRLESLPTDQDYTGMNVVWIGFISFEEGQMPIADDTIIELVDDFLEL